MSLWHVLYLAYSHRRLFACEVRLIRLNRCANTFGRVDFFPAVLFDAYIRRPFLLLNDMPSDCCYFAYKHTKQQLLLICVLFFARFNLYANGQATITTYTYFTRDSNGEGRLLNCDVNKRQHFMGRLHVQFTVANSTHDACEIWIHHLCVQCAWKMEFLMGLKGF